MFSQKTIAPSSSLHPTPTVRGLDPSKYISEYVHHTWQAEKNLPQGSAYTLCQTRDGYLWIGTAEGLARYDGAKFTVFDKGNTQELHHNTIITLMEDRDGGLWIGTFGGGVSCLRNGKWTSFTVHNGLLNDIVRAIVQDSTGTMWFGTNGGLDCLKNGVLTSYTSKNGLSNELVRSLLLNSNGKLWIGTDDGLFCLDNGEIKNLTSTIHLSNTTIRAMAQDHLSAALGGAVWIGTNAGLHCLQNGITTCFTTKNGLSGNLIRAILPDAQGSLWIGTDAGLSRLYRGQFSSYLPNDNSVENSVYALLQDREGSLWMGYDGGEGMRRFHNGIFSSYCTEYLSQKLIVRSITEAHEERGMWLATQGRGIFYLKNTDTTNFMEQRYSTENGLASDIVWSVLQDRAGTMWFGTKEGLCRLRKGKLSTFTIKDGLPSNVIYALMEAHDGALWVGTSGGLCCIRKGVFTSYTSSTATNPHKNNGHNNNLPNDRVFNLLEDRDSALWIGTNDGLSRFKNGVFTNFFTRNGLSHNAIHTLAQDSEGTIWIGTIGGLTRLKNGVLQSITTKQGLYNDVVYGILSDNNGYFWISCNKGIYRVRKDSLNACADGKLKQLSCQAFGTEDGMKSAECNGGTQPAAWKSRDGHLWFATIRGAVSINPNDVFFNPLPPYVIIESIKADTTALDLTATATVEADVQKFEFHYTATSLLVPDKVQFRYMLEGYDESWVEAGSRRVAYYTNLQRGRTYRFRVCACNNDGVWNDVGASSAMLYLAPYIWETWWAYSLYAALALSSAVLLMRYRERNQRRLLKQQYREREARHIYEKNLLLEETNVRLENLNVQLSDANANLSALNEEKSDIVGVVAHDLKNPVIGIQKLAYSLEGQARKSGLVQMQQSAAIIKDTAERMFTMIQQLLKVHAAEFGDNALTPITVDLGELAEKLRRDWQERAESQSVQLAVSIASKNPITAYADPFAFLQILENLLSNAVKVSPPNSVVRIWLGYESGYAVVEVQDFGAGMSMEHQQLLFSKFIRLSHKQQSGLHTNGLPQNELLQSKSTENEHSSGLGLYIVKKLTEAMNGKIHCVSAIGQGTTFTLFLPITSHKAAPPPSTRTPIEKPHH